MPMNPHLVLNFNENDYLCVSYTYDNLIEYAPGKNIIYYLSHKTLKNYAIINL